MSPHHDHTEKNGHGLHWHGGRILKTQEEGSDELLELIWTLREKGVTDSRTCWVRPGIRRPEPSFSK